MVSQLREAGLPADVAIVRVEAPFTTGFGHSWGDTEADQATSRARVRARLRELLGDSDLPSARVVIAGFSQGAGMAIDMAVEEPRIGAVASFSPCYSRLRGELPKRDLRVLLAHGTKDTVCPIEESRSLARALEAAHKPARYIEFDGAHTVPPEVVRALVELTTARPSP
jgi:phospholipase/carboxylesterase